MKKFIIDKNDEGQRLDKFMHRVMPAAGTGKIYKSLRKKKVRVNGKHTDGAYRLKINDEVCMYINDEFFAVDDKVYEWMKASSKIDIIYEDENIIVVNKPGGMPSQDIGDIVDSLESRVRAYLYSKKEIDMSASPLFIPSLCHRIDRNTSGIVIAAKNSAALRIINDKIKNREIRKFYMCETENPPVPDKGKIEGWIAKSNGNGKMIFSEKEINGGSYALTLYKTIKNGKPSLVEAELLTGRTHQIRVGFSHIGCPLAGDVKYGAAPDGKKKYQHLVSYKVKFDFVTDAGILNYIKGKIFEIKYNDVF